MRNNLQLMPSPKWINPPGSNVGRSWIGAAGSAVGHFARSAISAAIPMVFGGGAYSVGTNSLMSGQVPMMHSTDDSVRICHREYIGDLISHAVANSFKVQSFDINPGLSATFPWLASIAAQFSQYQILGLIFEFKSNSGNALNSVNTALGSVIMNIDYNTVANSPAEKSDMLGHMWTVDGAPSQNLIAPLECDPAVNPNKILYVRYGAILSNESELTFDMGRLNVATSGLQGTSVNVGELWVSYDIVLRKPIQSQYVPTGAVYYNHGVSTPATGTMFAGMTSAGDTIGLTLVNSVLYLPNNKCHYLITYGVVGTAAAVTAPTVVPTNCTIISNMFDNATNGYNFAPPSGVSAARCLLQYAVSVPGAGLTPYITFSGFVGPTSATDVTLAVVTMTSDIS
jgi:hypothetical protein